MIYQQQYYPKRKIQTPQRPATIISWQDRHVWFCSIDTHHHVCLPQLSVKQCQTYMLVYVNRAKPSVCDNCAAEATHYKFRNGNEYAHRLSHNHFIVETPFVQKTQTLPVHTLSADNYICFVNEATFQNYYIWIWNFLLQCYSDVQWAYHPDLCAMNGTIYVCVCACVCIEIGRRSKIRYKCIRSTFRLIWMVHVR